MIRFIIIMLFIIPFRGLAEDKPFTVTVKIQEVKDQEKLWLNYYDPAGKEIIDSALSKNGVFIFKGKLGLPVEALITLKNKEQNQSYFFKFFIGRGETEIVTDPFFKESKISDQTNINAEARELKKIEEDDKANRKKINDWYAGLPEVKLADSMTDKLYKQKIVESRKLWAQRLLDFIKKHPTSRVSLLAFKNILASDETGLRKSDILTQFENLQVGLKKSEEGENIYINIERLEKLEVGVSAPNFNVKNKDGKSVNLDQFKGKYLVLDFGSSRCSPCELQNKVLTFTYAKYKDKKFAILGISVDTERKRWIEAIKDQQLEWEQICDFNGIHNGICKLYRLQSYPDIILIDPDGKILAIHPTIEELNNKLAELFR